MCLPCITRGRNAKNFGASRRSSKKLKHFRHTKARAPKSRHDNTLQKMYTDIAEKFLAPPHEEILDPPLNPYVQSDLYAQKILDQHGGTSRKPVHTKGDGSCLFHAASIGISGFHNGIRSNYGTSRRLNWVSMRTHIRNSF